MKRLNASRSMASACAYSSIRFCGSSLWPMGVRGCDGVHATGTRLRPTMGRGAPSWPTENVAALVKRALRRLDPRLAAQAAPLFLLRTDEGGEFFRRIRGGIGAAGAQLLAHLWRVVGAHE